MMNGVAEPLVKPIAKAIFLNILIQRFAFARKGTKLFSPSKEKQLASRVLNLNMKFHLWRLKNYNTSASLRS